jgi:rfaE bifunctional protein nucleotidyltransferase chain/domain
LKGEKLKQTMRLKEFQEKIWPSIVHAKEQVQKWKNNGLTIAFTNGCFDILHKGHVSYLHKASLKADKLVLALNSDDSIKRLNKSPNRPLQDETSRSFVMASLEFVDAVIIFNEDTPLNVIKELLPDVLVKGADYNKEEIVGYKEVTSNGGKVETIDLEHGYSTSAIENKILENRD